MALVLPGVTGRLFVTVGKERRAAEEEAKRLPHQVVLATLILLTIDFFLHRTKWLLVVKEDMDMKVERHTSPVLRTTLVIMTVGLFLHRARWHFFVRVETIVGEEEEEEEGEVEERPRHQARGRGVDMTTAATALKHLVIQMIDLALLRVMQ